MRRCARKRAVGGKRGAHAALKAGEMPKAAGAGSQRVLGTAVNTPSSAPSGREGDDLVAGGHGGRGRSHCRRWGQGEVQAC